MKILLANKFYYRRGGADIHVLDLERLLKEQGHEVAVFSMQHPENLSSPWDGYFPSEIKFHPSVNMKETLFRPFGLGEVRKRFIGLLNAFRPDVVHAHNIHTQLSPVIMGLAKSMGIRTVWTLHDYKLLCPCYVCRMKKGSCELCFSHGAEDRRKDLMHCIRNKCVKNSIAGSVIGYYEALCWNSVRLQNVTDAFICPSRFMADKMRDGGFLASDMRVLYNFVDTGKFRMSDFEKDDYYCYIGRLSEEKGLKSLIEAANRMPHRKLIVAGSGDMRGELQGMAKGNVVFTGKQSWDGVKSIVSKARFTVIPSEWYENCPLSVIESLCLGTPVLGARIGGIPELIGGPSVGLTFESGNADDLADKIGQMFGADFDYEGIAAASLSKYDAISYYNRIMAVYNP